MGLAAVGVSFALGACGSAPAMAPGTASVVSAPVRIAHTRLGAVGYRVVGTGPPLVLIMGYAGTMEVWDPRLVHDLARHNRVVMFDNAGVGRTQRLPGERTAALTIDAMANQASALIDTLGLHRPDVLGWSMGGMIAQALAVLHPAQERQGPSSQERHFRPVRCTPAGHYATARRSSRATSPAQLPRARLPSRPSRPGLISGKQLAHPRTCLAALASRQIGAEVLDMDLDPSPVSGEIGHRHATFLPHDSGLVNVGGQGDLDGLLVRLVRFPVQQQPPRSLAGLHSPRAFPSAGKHPLAIFPAQPCQVSKSTPRLHRGGDRDANSAPWRIALVRMHCR